MLRSWDTPGSPLSRTTAILFSALWGAGICHSQIANLGPSIVTPNGRQLMVKKRNLDGSLGPEIPYSIRGVNWSPASISTANSIPQRRGEFSLWVGRDAPLLRAMNVNTVFLYLDPGADASGLAVLDELFRNGIMVVMTVDDGRNDPRIGTVVNYYKSHPAVLMWSLGNEWNINLYHGNATSVPDAAQKTQDAARAIKLLDTNHPVATSYGEIDINDQGRRLADTTIYVQTTCVDVDVWGLNIYRGQNFGALFTQWQNISSKPMFLGEFGSDAFRSYSQAHPPNGRVDEMMQADWFISLWNHLRLNLSADNSSRVALGGFAFEWNDEWWKAPPAGSQETDGCDASVCAGHGPDQFGNEDYFGLVDLERRPRQAYCALRTAFSSGYPGEFPSGIYRAESRGFLAQEFSPQQGVARFSQNGYLTYEKTGQNGLGRGFNVLAIDPATGNAIAPGQNYDTVLDGGSPAAMTAMINFLNGLPAGTLIMIGVVDDAGLNPLVAGSCQQRPTAWTESGIQAIEALGSRMIRDYCFQDSWAMIAVKGETAPRGEALGRGVPVSVSSSTANLSCRRPVAALRDQAGNVRAVSYPDSALSSSGASFVSRPALALDRFGNGVVAARDPSGALWLNVFDAGPRAWRNWIYAAGGFQGSAALAVGADDTIHIFSRDNSNSYWYRRYSQAGGFSSWTALSGVFSSDPVAASCADGNVYIVGVDTSSSLWSARILPGGSFQGWSFGGGTIKGSPSITCGVDNAAYVAARDSSDSSWIARVAGNTWTGWFNGGAAASVDPQVARLGGRIGVVILGPNGAVWRNAFLEGAGNGWSAWKPAGGVLQSFDLAADSDARLSLGSGQYQSTTLGGIHLLGVAPNQQLWWWRQGGNQWTWISNQGLASGGLGVASK